MFGPGHLFLVPQGVLGPAHQVCAATQCADVAQDRPHRRGAAVRVENGFAHHVQRPHVAVGQQDPEFAVYRPAVHQAVGHHGRQEGLVLGEEHRRQLVEGQASDARSPAEDLTELVGPADLVGEQVPLRASHSAQQGARRRPGRRPGGPVSRGLGGRHVGDAVPQLSQILAEVVQLMDGEVAECPLPAQLGIVVVDDGGVAPYRVHIAAQQPGPVDQGVDGVPLGRLWGGGVRKQMGRHLVLRYRRYGRFVGVDRTRLLHRLEGPVRALATLDTFLLLAYAVGGVGRGSAEHPCPWRLVDASPPAHAARRAPARAIPCDAHGSGAGRMRGGAGSRIDGVRRCGSERVRKVSDGAVEGSSAGSSGSGRAGREGVPLPREWLRTCACCADQK